MQKLFVSLTAIATISLATPSAAELPVGAAAPAIQTQAALGGKVMSFSLKQALKKGPVVLYFYPKAYTKGCTLEARAFAEASDQFAAAGATVIGMSADDLPTLQRFSTEECRNKFAVGVATPATITAYDVALKLPNMPGGYSSRTSYVIAKNGKISFVHSDIDYREHVAKTLAAVKALRR